jgi:hypothetical protein
VAQENGWRTAGRLCIGFRSVLNADDFDAVMSAPMARQTNCVDCRNSVKLASLLGLDRQSAVQLLKLGEGVYDDDAFLFCPSSFASITSCLPEERLFESQS